VCKITDERYILAVICNILLTSNCESKNSTKGMSMGQEKNSKFYNNLSIKIDLYFILPSIPLKLCPFVSLYSGHL
jgi:hypothetical protein